MVCGHGLCLSLWLWYMVMIEDMNIIDFIVMGDGYDIYFMVHGLWVYGIGFAYVFIFNLWFFVFCIYLWFFGYCFMVIVFGIWFMVKVIMCRLWFMVSGCSYVYDLRFMVYGYV